MYTEKYNIVVEYIKDSFLEIIKVISNRYGEDYTFDMTVERNTVNDYTDSYKILLNCIYKEQDLQFSLIVIFYDEDKIYSLFNGDRGYSIPDIVSIKLIQTKLSCTYMNLLQQTRHSNIDRLILGITMSVSTLLDKTDLANLMIEEFLLG